MKKQELRKVQFQHSIDGGYSFQTYKGLFHQWGVESSESHNEDGSSYVVTGTIGIIEEENGDICTLSPTSITFLD